MNLLVLVVEDEPDVEMLFRQNFGAIFDRAVLRWSSPNLATWRFGINDAAGVSIILILSDIDMPGMTGLSCCPRLRQLDLTSR